MKAYVCVPRLQSSVCCEPLLDLLVFTFNPRPRCRRPFWPCTSWSNLAWPPVPLSGAREHVEPNQVLMYTAMKSIFEDKNNQEDLFFKGPGKDLDVRASP